MFNVNPFYGQENSQSFSFLTSHIDDPFSCSIIMRNGSSVPRFDFGDGFASASTSVERFFDGSDSSTVTVNVSRLDYIERFDYPVTFRQGGDGIRGHLDISKWTRLYNYFKAPYHTLLTGVTFPTQMDIDDELVSFDLKQCDIQGHIELTGMTNVGRTYPNFTSFYMYGNSGITSVNFPSTTKNVYYNFNSCDLKEVDLSMVSGYPGFDFSSNPSLSSITFAESGQTLASYGDIRLESCDFKEIDFTPLGDKLGGRIRFQNNTSLTAATFPTTTAPVTELWCYGCGFTEDYTLDLRPIENLGGSIVIRSNAYGEVLFPSNETVITTFTARDLTKVKHVNVSPLSGMSTFYNFNSCAMLTGITFPTGNLYPVTGFNLAQCDFRDLDLTNLTGLTDVLNFHQNSSLTAVTFPTTSEPITYVHCYFCDIRNLDLSNLTGLEGTIQSNSNNNMTGFTFPPTSGTVTEFISNNCDLGAINFHTLSGANQDNIFINLNDNSTTVTECNQILESISGMNAQNGVLHLSGSSGSATGAEGYDTSSGGINGYSIYSDLITNSGWTIFMSGLTA